MLQLLAVISTCAIVSISSSIPNDHFTCTVTLPKQCKCDMSQMRVTCIGKRKKLNYIPVVPKYLKKLKFSNNCLLELSDTSFMNITRSTIRFLTLSDNEIGSIAAGSFLGFSSLTNLDFSGNWFIEKDNSNRFIEILLENIKHSPLRKVVLDNAIKGDITPGVLKALTGVKTLNHLSLKRNAFRIFNDTVFRDLSNLTIIDVSTNGIEHYKFTGSTSLTKLIMNKNKISLKKYALCYENGNAKFPNLRSLELRSNMIDRIDNTTFFCMENLRYLYLDENPVRKLKNNIFARMSSLRLVSMKSMLNRLESIHSFALNISSLEKLYLDGNHLVFRDKYGVFDLKNIFKWSPNLRNLDLSNNNFVRLSRDQFFQMFSPLRNLHTLVLQGSMIVSLPPNVFSYLISLRRLILNGNKFSGWNPSVFWNVSHLEDLSMEGCNIHYLNKTSFPQSVLTSLKRVSLANNPFSCTCDILWLKQWMRNTSVQFLNYPGRYKCSFPTKWNGFQIMMYEPSETICNLIGIINANMRQIIVTFVAVGIGVFYKWWSVTTANNNCNNGEIGPIDLSKYKFDAFVSYNEIDRQWVVETLVPAMEGENNLILCVHERDFQSGLIKDNIVKSMKESRSIIFVLSNNFNSFHCILEAELSFEYFKTNGTVILILLEELDKTKIDPAVDKLIKTYTYIKWTKEDGNSLASFWAALLENFKEVIRERQLQQQLETGVQ